MTVYTVSKTIMMPACREAGGITSFSSLLRHGKELHQDLLHTVLHALQALALDEASSVQMLQTGALSSCPKLLDLQEDPVSALALSATIGLNVVAMFATPRVSPLPLKAAGTVACRVLQEDPVSNVGGQSWVRVALPCGRLHVRANAFGVVVVLIDCLTCNCLGCCPSG